MTKRVDEVMAKSLQTATPDSTLKDVFAQMQERRIRHVPVVEKPSGKLVGFISDRDVKRFISPFAGSNSATDRDNATLNIRLEKVMVKDVITALPSDSVKSVVEKMLQKRINAVPIVDEDKKLVGIVTSTDMLKLLLHYL